MPFTDSEVYHATHVQIIGIAVNLNLSQNNEKTPNKQNWSRNQLKKAQQG